MPKSGWAASEVIGDGARAMRKKPIEALPGEIPLRAGLFIEDGPLRTGERLLMLCMSVAPFGRGTTRSRLVDAATGTRVSFAVTSHADLRHTL